MERGGKREREERVEKGENAKARYGRGRGREGIKERRRCTPMRAYEATSGLRLTHGGKAVDATCVYAGARVCGDACVRAGRRRGKRARAHETRTRTVKRVARIKTRMAAVPGSRGASETVRGYEVRVGREAGPGTRSSLPCVPAPARRAHSHRLTEPCLVYGAHG